VSFSVNFPTIITFSRILIIIPFIWVASRNPLLGAILFAIAAITDFLDGYLARRSQQITKTGILLDPIADKLLVIAAIIVLVDMELVPAWIAIVIIAREFIITGLRVVALSKDILIPAEMGGKIKVVAQIASILVLLLDKDSLFKSFIDIDLYGIGITLLWIAMILSVTSGIQYFILFWKKL
jgi:CDP-diacylglycerol--glycerol-3-phosphate 3-phosphatidyltransferase